MPPRRGAILKNGLDRQPRTGFDDGLVLGNAPGARISGVTATDSADDGIAVRNSPGVRVAGSTAARNGGDGIDVGGCNSCMVIGNRIFDLRRR